MVDTPHCFNTHLSSGNAESYNPPAEYLPTPEEREKWENEEPSERSSNFLSEKYPCLRHVPAYPNLINEKFERCLGKLHRGLKTG